MKKIIILGAGPTGLSAAYRLQELGYSNFTVYERNSYPGGLSASFSDKRQFVWDIGGHVIFSHYEYFDRVLEALLGSEILEHRRNAWIRTKNQWVAYPFQNNIGQLSDKIKEECIKGLNECASKTASSRNFKEWITNNMGSGVAKHFMFPYNTKAWAYPLELIGTNWLTERVSQVSTRDISADSNRNSWGPNARFKYPLKGGVGRIFQKMSKCLPQRIKFNMTVVKIDTHSYKIYFSDNREDNYDVLINTSPLDALINSFQDQQSDLINAAEKLKHNGAFIVGLGLKKPTPSSKSWIYFPDGDSPFFRATYLSNYSPHNTPDPTQYYSLLCESAYSGHKKKTESQIVEDTIQGLINSGVLSERDRESITTTFSKNVDYAYPIPTIERDEALKYIQPKLEAMQIYSRGRFGAWKYEIGNTDHSVVQGKEVVDRILKKDKESIWSI